MIILSLNSKRVRHWVCKETSHLWINNPIFLTKQRCTERQMKMQKMLFISGTLTLLISLVPWHTRLQSFTTACQNRCRIVHRTNTITKSDSEAQNRAQNHTHVLSVNEYLAELLLSCKSPLVTFDYEVNAVQLRIFIDCVCVSVCVLTCLCYVKN